MKNKYLVFSAVIFIITSRVGNADQFPNPAVGKMVTSKNLISYYSSESNSLTIINTQTDKVSNCHLPEKVLSIVAVSGKIFVFTLDGSLIVFDIDGNSIYEKANFVKGCIASATSINKEYDFALIASTDDRTLAEPVKWKVILYKKIGDSFEGKVLQENVRAGTIFFKNQYLWHAVGDEVKKIDLP